MVKEQLTQRHQQLERELSQLCYRQVVLSRELDAIGKRVVALESGLTEIESAQRALDTEAVIESAKQSQEVKPNE